MYSVDKVRRNFVITVMGFAATVRLEQSNEYYFPKWGGGAPYSYGHLIGEGNRIFGWGQILLMRATESAWLGPTDPQEALREYTRTSALFMLRAYRFDMSPQGNVFMFLKLPWAAR
jgi:hypothetical protein